MSRTEAQNHDNHQSIADRVAARVASALKKEKNVVPAPRALSAIVGAVIESYATLPAYRRQELNEHPEELSQRVRHLVEELARSEGDTVRQVIHLKAPDKVETSQGGGLGAILDREAGRTALAGRAVSRAIAEWAGPVAGATELERTFGIPRSTLNRWQHTGDVISLLKGTRNRVYPTEQFVDGRPVRGIRDIRQLARSERVAWLWMSRENPLVGGKRPIDLLRQERVDEVIAAAQAYFTAA